MPLPAYHVNVQNHQPKHQTLASPQCGGLLDPEPESSLGTGLRRSRAETLTDSEGVGPVILVEARRSALWDRKCSYSRRGLRV